MADDPGAKKIIIDEDWKRRVETEREELANQPSGAEAKTTDGPASGAGRMPPASLEMLLTTLATEALIALGQVPHPATGKQEAHLDQAKYFIDTIDMLRVKTDGNLAAEEKAALEGLLHQLRTAYVASIKVASTTTPGGSPPPAS